MKKLLILLLSLITCFSVFSGCSTGDGNSSGDGGDDLPVEPIWATEYSFDESGHWYAQLNGDGKKGYEPHDNFLGKCYSCDYYFATDDLEFTLKYKMVNGEPEFYYSVTDYLGYDSGADVHIKVPLTHKQPAPEMFEDEEGYDAVIDEYSDIISETEYPVLEIGAGAFSGGKAGKSSIESIVLQDGLKKIGGSAFTKTFITELIIPDSVEGSIYNICGGCINLKNVVIGEGITLIDGYAFSECSALRYVHIGSNVREIQRRAFYGCKSIQYLVIPKSVVSIPEDEIYSQGKYVTMNNLFQGGYSPVRGIFMEITEAEYDDLYLPLKQRDPITGLTINPETGEVIPHNQSTYTTYGYVHGWCHDAKLYFKDEWHYNEDGVPTPN
ncbi:MAG: leucine-rich repeat domain-containing protein [Clostridia bacterium]|nr:leucine-rich repeat domain-containing protein [Clostridia bacterium]